MKAVMKKQKKEKVVPTQEQLNKMVMDYLKQSSNHTFKYKYFYGEKEDGVYPDNYYKVFPAMVDGKLQCVTITIDSKGDVKAGIIDTTWTHTKNALGILKNRIFPQNKRHKSFRTNKEMWQKFNKIKDYLSGSDLTSSDLKEKILEIIKG